MKVLSWIAVMVLLAGAAGAQEMPMFPFALPWDDASKTIVDVSALNPAPVGANGQIVAKNGHFQDGTGRRVRFLGVNIVGDACFPEKADAEKVAARLRKFGVNIARMHHMDAPWVQPNNIFSSADRVSLDRENLDRLDYLIYQLKQHGIYTNINLHVSRTFTAADGFPEADRLPEMGKIVNFFEPRMIALQKRFAKDLLTHANPYTKTRYVDEPCLAVVEINNENTLLGAAWENRLPSLPPTAKAELAKAWNAWLKEKYTDTDSLKRAWSAKDKPLGPNLLRNADFSRGAEHWNLELNQAPASAKMLLPEDVAAPEGAKGKVIRLQVQQLGGANWHIQFHQAGLDLTEGEPYTVSFWARSDKPRPLSLYASLDRDDYHHIGLDGGIALTPEWQKFTFAFTASRTLKDHNRLTFILGDALGAVDLAGLTLQPGVETPFPAGANLTQGNMPFGLAVANPAGEDWIAFLIEMERRYMQGMRDYLKKDLGLKAMVTGSQASYGGLGGALREAMMDFTDMHAYWQHPEFPGAAWDPKNWRIQNGSMVRAADGGALPGLAQYRIAGRPFTVSEYNNAAPNDFQAETLPLLAAFAAVQDWDGIYLFDYNSDRTQWKTDRIKGFFSIDTNPAKMAFFPAAAMLFLRNDMALAYGELRLRVPTDDVAPLLAKNGRDIAALWTAAGIGPRDALTQRLSLAFTREKRPMEKPASPSRINDDEIINKPGGKGPIEWPTDSEKPVFTADSPSSKVMVGFLGGKNQSLPGWMVQMSETPANFAALTLSAVDGKPMEQSKSLLLTAVGRVENRGMGWNAARTSVGDQWGAGPTQAEGIPARVTIRTLAASATVYALDGTGARQGTVPSELSGGMLSFLIGPDHKTLWYEVEAK